MDNEQLEMMKEDLIAVQMSRPTRLEAARIANRVTDAIADMAKGIAEKAVEEHLTCDLHKWYDKRES
ncbi:hypothetical protein LCGC14_2729760 [marine sediment metagenome]|uniref:Uncharacterized protein n=1 Tax=marine sediment metagenome TaxID=412755 RepID=A0A0F8Z7S0_9ZZZZ